MTFSDNMRNQGVFLDINKKVTQLTNKVLGKEFKVKGLKGAKKADRPLQEADIEEIELEDLQRLRQRQVQDAGENAFQEKKHKNLTIDERHALEDIVAKYGQNFKKAHLDKAVNRFWWNKQQMQRAYDRYVKQYGHGPGEGDGEGAKE